MNNSHCLHAPPLILAVLEYKMARRQAIPGEQIRQALEEVCKGKDEVLAAKEQEIAAKERALSNERQRVSSLADECATLKGRLEGKTEEIKSLQAHVRTVEV